MNRPRNCGKRSNAMKEINIALKFKWYELLLICIEAGLLFMAFWSCVDSILIAAPVAAWHFFLFFIVLALPGAALLVFFKPKKQA